MTDTFSTAASHAFEHPELDELAAVHAGPSSEVDILEAFEVEDTVQRIIDGGYRTVSLFPTSSHSCVVRSISKQRGSAELTNDQDWLTIPG